MVNLFIYKREVSAFTYTPRPLLSCLFFKRRSTIDISSSDYTIGCDINRTIMLVALRPTYLPRCGLPDIGFAVDISLF